MELNNILAATTLPILKFTITRFNSLLFNTLANKIGKENFGFTEDDIKRELIVTFTVITVTNVLAYIKFQKK